jgi:hypothetical protein
MKKLFRKKKSPAELVDGLEKMMGELKTDQEAMHELADAGVLHAFNDLDRVVKDIISDVRKKQSK